MKDLDYYKRLPYHIRTTPAVNSSGRNIERPFVSEYIELEGCSAEGNGYFDAEKNLYYKFDDYIQKMIESGKEIPEPDPSVESENFDKTVRCYLEITPKYLEDLGFSYEHPTDIIRHSLIGYTKEVPKYGEGSKIIVKLNPHYKCGNGNRCYVVLHVPEQEAKAYTRDEIKIVRIPSTIIALAHGIETIERLESLWYGITGEKLSEN